jgi:15-cis-phytoene synthase
VSAASEITRNAKSNLAFALNILPRERRDDMVVFYAFCRTMDDLADAPGASLDERATALSAWADGIRDGFANPDAFQQEVRALRDKHDIPNELLLAIIDGCTMDLAPRSFETWEDLSEYIWKVACAVGLVSIRLFGCRHPDAEPYAIALGHALQLTNILRDIGEDFSNGRVYLPRAEIRDFGLGENLAAHADDPAFLALMEHQAARAEDYFRKAEALLPPGDRDALLPARIMAEIYERLLAKMRAGGFKVFSKRYRISKPRKLAILSKHLIARPA